MDIFEQVKKILCDQLDLEEEQVNEDSEVIDDLGADSLDIVDLVMTLEEEFDTEIPDEDIENLKTVGDIVKYIEEPCCGIRFFRTFPKLCSDKDRFVSKPLAQSGLFFVDSSKKRTASGFSIEFITGR